ncbi:hypothetical protein BKA67DRAFT_665287 [Truncatella angustata]|uniref:Uncharacterized protein n=1 Tax=Truncatella angustata TaxID=152316 RepID=A0A9P8UAJ1_9PEZI|nr:uncharacterized protein BKA67DRAFT_665287 [Truncatella angustata]KAH6643481.1 hypothetical protein BKA67DRAFT_665287 [Truncatella angustata]
MPVTSQSMGVFHVVASIFCLYPILAAAIDTVKGSVTVFQATGDEGPWKEPIEDFEARLDAPNATGNYRIAGPNISVPYTDDNTLDGWSWSLAVTADLPIASELASKYGSEKFYTGGKLTFNAPASLLASSTQYLTVNDDWQICLFNWEISNVDYPDKLRTDDGSCSSVLTSECITDLQKAVATRSSPYQCNCPVTKDILSCATLGDDSGLWQNTCVARLFNSTHIREWEDGKLDTWTYGGATLHDSGNVTDYNYIGSIAWPVMASFGTGTYQKGTLSCLRATNGTQGSTAPTGKSFQDGTGSATSDEGSGSQMWLNTFWVIFGFVLASSAIAL